MSDKQVHVKNISTNRRARHDYEILEKFEAGLVLKGTEIKSLRAGKASISEAYAKFEGDELYIVGMDIPPYFAGNRFNHEALRPRKLLLHRSELNKLARAVEQDGLTIVPLKIYLKNQYAKLEIALARGKKLYDKRQSEKKKSEERAMREWRN